VTDAFPPDYTGVSWTCAASGGASCAPGGNGSIDQSVDLPPGSQVVYTVQGIVASDAIGVLSNTASAAVVAPTVDPTGSNNSATVDISPAGPLDEIFVSGFDG
jgi:hypothetical protein